MEELLASSYMFVMYAYILHVYFYISYWPHDIYTYIPHLMRLFASFFASTKLHY